MPITYEAVEERKRVAGRAIKTSSNKITLGIAIGVAFGLIGLSIWLYYRSSGDIMSFVSAPIVKEKKIVRQLDQCDIETPKIDTPEQRSAREACYRKILSQAGNTDPCDSLPAGPKREMCVAARLTIVRQENPEMTGDSKVTTPNIDPSVVVQAPGSKKPGKNDAPSNPVVISRPIPPRIVELPHEEPQQDVPTNTSTTSVDIPTSTPTTTTTPTSTTTIENPPNPTQDPATSTPILCYDENGRIILLQHTNSCQ